jgi:hypothetical protein
MLKSERQMMFTPIIGRLSDCGFISFENTGELIIRFVAHEDLMKKMGTITDRVVNVGGFAEPHSYPLRSKSFSASDGEKVAAGPDEV